MIYIDKRGEPGHIGRLCGLWYHLWTDGPEEELHQFAERNGMRRQWFQKKRIMNHYDVFQTRRPLAVRLGAKEMYFREFYKERMANNGVPDHR